MVVHIQIQQRLVERATLAAKEKQCVLIDELVARDEECDFLKQELHRTADMVRSSNKQHAKVQAQLTEVVAERAEFELALIRQIHLQERAVEGIRLAFNQKHFALESELRSAWAAAEQSESWLQSQRSDNVKRSTDPLTYSLLSSFCCSIEAADTDLNNNNTGCFEQLNGELRAQLERDLLLLDAQAMIITQHSHLEERLLEMTLLSLREKGEALAVTYMEQTANQAELECELEAARETARSFDAALQDAALQDEECEALQLKLNSEQLPGEDFQLDAQCSKKQEECGKLQGLLEYNKMASEQKTSNLESLIAASKEECSTLLADLEECKSEQSEKLTELEEQTSILSAQREQFAASLLRHSHMQERMLGQVGQLQEAVTKIRTQRTEFEETSSRYLQLQDNVQAKIIDTTAMDSTTKCNLEITFENQLAEREACEVALAYHLKLHAIVR